LAEKEVSVEERHLSLSEAIDVLGISERTGYRWIKSGKLRAYKPGRDYWIPESAIKEVVEESKVRPKTDRRSPYEPSFNDVLAEERRLEQRIRLLNSAAEMWEALAAGHLSDLERLSLEELLAIDAVSLNIELDHAKEARAMKRAVTAEQRARLEAAERRCVEANRAFIREVENTLERQRPADLEEWRAKFEERRRASEAASEATGA
jgi:excisionase family DNA binding protein